jgi:recombination protein RecA
MLIAMAQKQGKTAAWIDCEMTFDPEWAQRLGVDLDNLIIVQENSINQVTKTGVDLLKAEVDIMVIDSISDVIPSAFWNDNDEMKNFEDSQQIGSQSKDLGRMSMMFLGINQNTMILMISQQTTNIGQQGKQEPTGGNKIKHNSSTIIKLFSSESVASAIKEKVAIGDTLVETIVGRPVVWEVQFNKTAAQGPRGEYSFFFDGDHRPGISKESELVKMGILYGLINKAGSWLSYGDIKIQGENSLAAKLHEDKVLSSEIEEKIYELSGRTPEFPGTEETTTEEIL